MRIRLTRDTLVSGAAHSAGDVIDASSRDAGLLLATGKAQRLSEVEAEKAEAREAVIAKAIPGGKRQRAK